MKKILTVILSAIAFGIIAGAVMVCVNVVSSDIGIGNKNVVSNIANKITGNVSTPSEVKNEVKNDENTEKVTVKYYEGTSDIVELVDEVMPSVVSITNMQKFTQNGYSIFGFRQQAREYEAPAAGSGVIVKITDDEIIILTNNHVVQDSSSLTATFYDTETIDAAIKGTDSSKDLAIISVKKTDVKKEILDKIRPANLGDSDKIKVGERVVAIGNALGIGQSVTTGIVSAKNREIEGIENSAKLIQTDAAINPGNSGGALLNMRGQLIGINVAKSSGNAVEGIGYAIPVNDATIVIDTLSNKKAREALPEKEQAYLGINARNIDNQTAASLDMPEGVYVFSIDDASPVKKSELKVRDIIVSIDDQNIKTVSELQDLLKYIKGGSTVHMKVKRSSDGEWVDKEFDVVVGTKPADQIKESKDNNNKKNNSNENEQNQENENPNGGEYFYDPFSEFEDFFGRGFFGW